MGLKHKRKRQHGTTTTMALVIILVLVLLLIWSEFISGPNRVKEQIYAQRIEKIIKQINSFIINLVKYGWCNIHNFNLLIYPPFKLIEIYNVCKPLLIFTI